MRYLGLLARLLYDPVGAVSALRAARPIGAAMLVAVPMTLLYELALTPLLRDVVAIVRFGAHDQGAAMIMFSYLYLAPRLLVPAVFLVAVYLPTALFFLGVFSPGVTVSDLMRRDYSTSLGVTLSVWSVTLALWLVPALLLADPTSFGNRVLWSALPLVTFLVPEIVNFERAASSGYGRATVAALLGGVSLYLLPVASSGIAFLLGSPLLLIITFVILRGVFRDWAAASGARRRLEQSLSAATLNPADASAHANLGLIYEERGELDRASEHYRRAIEIDPEELDARFGLGRVDRVRGRLAEAIASFDAVVQVDPDFRNGEVWREIGSTYYAAGQYEDALPIFERFAARRPSDAEGLYKLGLTFAALGRADEARASMQSVVDAVRMAPVYKHRLERRWLAEAESFLRNR